MKTPKYKPTLCPHCNCVTKTIKGRCGKCEGVKVVEELTENEKGLFIAGAFYGMEQLAKDLGGSCGRQADQMIHGCSRAKVVKEILKIKYKK